MRQVVVLLEINDELADNKNMGTIDYVEQEFGWLQESGIFLKQARIIDEDDLEDTQFVKLTKALF